MTQNIDGLHERAGVPIERIIEIHGNTHTSHCMTCGFTIDSAVSCPVISFPFSANLKFSLKSIYKQMEDDGVKVPLCKCGGFMHPNTISCMHPLPHSLFTNFLIYL